MRSRILLVSIVALALLPACKSQYDAIFYGSDVQAKYKMAFDLFEAKKYTKAAETFESLTMATRGTAQEDTVQFYWGLSNYRYGDYITAESNFQEFINTFPVSPFTEEAKFLHLDCLYHGTYRYELDQMPTYKALSAMSVFQIENPDSKYHDRVAEMMDELNNRLELKAYKSAWLYYHMEDYLAAHYALKNVLKDNADNRYREDILYYTAMAAYKYALNSVPSKQRERYLVFVDDYFNIVSEFPESKYLKELEGLYNKAQKQLKKDNENG
ncbi:MAG: outer membrane protein assembly factor BamD [Bacteroidales bacterium]|jgi:outer membrane protein assembly factor BamD|nr:outer membrane protein assembly factor BamD [Bacteroidales bacterium]MBQ1708147.1 outer membrane protein assembly factor BamD [Bacteroidales bacterium]MBQ2598157.1 outer membrane protein assembly factor BamD [Bacteroidales bacterium]MBQ4012410.1 outer membrane protein assembly factor BamD [Bacteroidales bacterium]